MHRYDDAGKLILRLAVGLLILLHGIYKLANGIGGISGMVAAHGWPSWVAYGVLVGEVLAPILLILGVFTRPAALLVVVNMAVAVVLVHTGDLYRLSESGGWRLELQAMYLFGALAIALLGAGRFSLTGSGGRYN